MADEIEDEFDEIDFKYIHGDEEEHEEVEEEGEDEDENELSSYEEAVTNIF